jgi:serine phosphatase RsbU (regulator of sigma subunit)
MILDGAPVRARAMFDARVTIWSGPSGRAQAGGDWSAALDLPDGAIALTIGDVSGHGAPVAGAMAAARAAVLGAAGESRVPSNVLAAVNNLACSYGDAGTMVTSIFAVLDRRRGTLSFANAGHPPPLVLTATSHAFLHQAPADLPLGVFRNYRAADYVIALPVDSLVLLYTDGITEHRRDPVGGELELVEAARAVYHRPELNAARAIARRVFMTSRGEDDAAAIGIRTLPPRNSSAPRAAAANGRRNGRRISSVTDVRR